MKCFLSGPYASHLIGQQAAIHDAMRSLSRLRHLNPVIPVDAVAPSEHCVWSPLIQGDVILWNTDGRWSEETALAWCLWNLEHAGFDTLIISSSPRKPDYGTNGVDQEQALACKLGYEIMSEADAEQVNPNQDIRYTS